MLPKRGCNNIIRMIQTFRSPQIESNLFRINSVVKFYKEFPYDIVALQIYMNFGKDKKIIQII